MPFELEFKLFLGDLSLNADRFTLLAENNNKKLYEINFIEHNEIIKDIYDDNMMENDYNDEYNQFILKMEDFLSDNDIKRLYVSVYSVIVDFSRYAYNKSITIIVENEI